MQALMEPVIHSAIGHSRPILMIGLNGPINAGKDTVAEILCRTMGFKRIAFADPLKDAASALFGVPRQAFDDREIKEEPLAQWKGRSPRDLVKWLGTDVIREQFDEDFILKRARLEADMAVLEFVDRGLQPRIVFSDVRFANEANFLRENFNAVIVHVDPSGRPGFRPEHPVGTGQPVHPTERGLPSHLIDHEIQNDGSIEDLERNVRRLMKIIQ